MLALGKALVRLHRVLRHVSDSFDEPIGSALLAILAPRERDRLNAWLYAGRPSYLPGSPYFAAGLADWEAETLSRTPFPSSGRFLIGGAGGGREVVPLQQRFEVWAFEPSPLVAGLVAVSAPGRAFAGSFADLVVAVEARRGPLVPLVAAAPFDAVLLGSIAFSHVMDRQEQLALLRALRTIAPAAPVLATLLIASPKKPAGARYCADHGLHYRFDEAELAALGNAAGYVLRREPGWPPESLIWLPRDASAPAPERESA